MELSPVPRFDAYCRLNKRFWQDYDFFGEDDIQDVQIDFRAGNASYARVKGTLCNTQAMGDVFGCMDSESDTLGEIAWHLYRKNAFGKALCKPGHIFVIDEFRWFTPQNTFGLTSEDMRTVLDLMQEKIKESLDETYDGLYRGDLYFAYFGNERTCRHDRTIRYLLEPFCEIRRCTGSLNYTNECYIAHRKYLRFERR